MGEINIVDEPMGSGKTFAAINYINNSDSEERFLVITPYKTEVNRYIDNCPGKKFVQPYRKDGRKLNSIKEYIRNGRNVVTTHALFQRFDHEMIELCSILNYTMILDEVAEVVKDTEFTTSDIQNLLNVYCDYNEETGLLSWREEYKDYYGKFNDAKNMCYLGGLALARDKMLMWIFPVEVFKAFQKTFILTYMFNAQLQRYYYDYYDVKYQYMSVDGDSLLEYHFVERNNKPPKVNYKNLVHILDNDKMNVIGKDFYSLSVGWYGRNSRTAIMKKLKDNIGNFFNNIRNTKTKYNMWTTFEDYRTELSGPGYTKGHLPFNARAVNEYRHKTSLAYTVNVFLNPLIKGFFQDHGVEIDEEGFALSEMLQWIWRSAIREGNEIWIYIPSSRMRNLLTNWINSISKTPNFSNNILNFSLDK